MSWHKKKRRWFRDREIKDDGSSASSDKTITRATVSSSSWCYCCTRIYIWAYTQCLWIHPLLAQVALFCYRWWYLYLAVFFFLRIVCPQSRASMRVSYNAFFFFASFFRGIFLWWLLTIIVTITCHNKKKCARRKGHRTRTHTHIKQNEMTNKEINAKMINFGDTKRACRERRILMASFFGW